MPVTKWDIEEQCQMLADKMARDVYGEEFDNLPLPTRCKLLEDAAVVVKVWWQEGVIRIKEALDGP